MEDHIVLSEEALVKKIGDLAAAIGELPSLSPSLEVNALFMELVVACIPPSSVDVDELGPEEQDVCRRLIHLCTDAEGHLEAHYSDLLAACDDPLDHLTLFPYFNNYIKLSQLEHGLLTRHVAGLPPARIAFVGSGPLPLSLPVLAVRHLPAASFDNYDICGEANERMGRLVRVGGMGMRMVFHMSDVVDMMRELAGYDMVFLVALVGMGAEDKARVVAHLGRHMAPNAALVVRSAHREHGFLYMVVDREEIWHGGFFEVLAVHNLEDEVINSVIIVRRKQLDNAAAADDDVVIGSNRNVNGVAHHTHEGGAVAVAVSWPNCLLCCEMEARAHQKMEEMAMDQELPS